MVVTNPEGCNTFSQLGSQFGGTSILAHFSCGTQVVMGSSRGPPVGATSSMGTSLDGMLVEVGKMSRESSKWRFGFQRTPLVGPHCQRQHHQKKKHTVPSSCAIPGQTPQKAWSTWHRWIGPLNPAL